MRQYAKIPHPEHSDQCQFPCLETAPERSIVRMPQVRGVLAISPV